MKRKGAWGMALAGGAAGLINGLFGAGGGLLLVPLLGKLTGAKQVQVFPASVAVMLPVCAVSLAVRALQRPLPLQQALPYLLGGIAGGLCAGLAERKIPTEWLHRALGIMILWGGLRYLW